MDYPRYPRSKPLSGKQAERVRKAILSGKSIENAASRRTVKRILEERRRQEAIANAEATGL
jgi:hypothetical protein